LYVLPISNVRALVKTEHVFSQPYQYTVTWGINTPRPPPFPYTTRKIIPFLIFSV